MEIQPCHADGPVRVMVEGKVAGESVLMAPDPAPQCVDEINM